MAWGLSTSVDATFAPSWRDEVGDRRRLSVNEPYPVADPPWEPVDGHRLASRPASLTNPRYELPTVRVHDGAFDVDVDFRFERSLEAIVTQLSDVTALHPNEGLEDEFEIPAGGGQVFPVQPSDPKRQAARIKELLDCAAHNDARFAVLPELCVSAEILEAIGERVHPMRSPFLLVAGSHHVVLDDARCNEAVAFVAGSRRRMTQLKNAPFTDELGSGRPSREGIDERDPLQINVYCADRFRFGIAVCRDLLDGRVRNAYDRMGVNVLAVPAMSAKTGPFLDAVAARVASAQSLTFVVNGPLHGLFDEAEPSIVIGRPILGPRSRDACMPMASRSTYVETLLKLDG